MVSIQVLPQPYDAYYFNWYYSENQLNDPDARITNTYEFIQDSTFENRLDIMVPDGFPTIIRNFVDLPSDEVVLGALNEANKDENVEIWEFSTQRGEHHIAGNCRPYLDKAFVNWDELQTMLADDVLEPFVGFDKVGPSDPVFNLINFDPKEDKRYGGKNLFLGNFTRTLISAGVHSAPSDNLAVQLLGRKTWLLIPPEEMDRIDLAMPRIAFVPAGYTDDGLMRAFPRFYVAEMGPGDALSFGPAWGHAVITHPGFNLMYNFRFRDPSKANKIVPLTTLTKAYIRFLGPTNSWWTPVRKDRKRDVFSSLQGLFNCGLSKAVTEMVDYFATHWRDHESTTITLES